MFEGGDLFVEIIPSSLEGTLCPSSTIFGGKNICSLEEYIAGVIYAENREGTNESYKAQSIAARTYLLMNAFSNSSVVTSSKINKTDGTEVTLIKVKSNQDFQVFESAGITNENIKSAVNETLGQVMLNNGKIFLSQYVSCSKTDGGVMKKQPFNGETVDDLYNCPTEYGHNNGMSQKGANEMAKDGKNYEEILNYFYNLDATNGIAVFNESMIP